MDGTISTVYSYLFQFVFYFPGRRQLAISSAYVMFDLKAMKISQSAHGNPSRASTEDGLLVILCPLGHRSHSICLINLGQDRGSRTGDHILP